MSTCLTKKLASGIPVDIEEYEAYLPTISGTCDLGFSLDFPNLYPRSSKDEFGTYISNSSTARTIRYSVWLDGQHRFGAIRR